MNSKLIGGILLVIGTTIGAGMLALPVATAQLGFWWSTLLLLSCWAVMTSSALLILEVNLWLPANTNLISMAGATLGTAGRIITWVVYLLFLYSILAAYISGGGDLLHYLISVSRFTMPAWSGPILFTIIFGIIVYCGMQAVDYVNRGLMSVKMGSYLLLILLLLPFISLPNLTSQTIVHTIPNKSISVSIVAFCFGMIIPSLRTYFGEDISSLRKAILIGTFIPLICYIAWNMVILGILPLNGLKQMFHSSTANSDLLGELIRLVPQKTVALLAKCFVSVCMTTSFLSVALCLSDFLSDGFKIDKKGYGNFVIFGTTFLPPLLAVIFYPDAFVRFLRYSGLYCIILMILLPAAMAWYGRYHHRLSYTYQVRGGKYLLVILIALAIFMLGQGIIDTVL